MSEDQLCFPFDINHIKINKYTHLGDSIDYFEVLRFQKVLGETLDYVLNDNTPDSPVYTFLDELIPPALKQEAEATAKQVTEALSHARHEEADQPITKEEENNTLSVIVKQGEEAIKDKQYDLARSLFNSALLISSCNKNQRVSSGNAYLIHRLAFATYKCEKPDKLTALKEANTLLSKLDLAHTNDSETVVLAGAVEKRLYEIGKGDNHLSNAILYYMRGFYLLNNRYNGINLAYLLNCKVNSSLDVTDEEKIADMVWANRIRQDVLRMCEKDWNAIIKREKTTSPPGKVDEELSKLNKVEENEQKFWILVNKAEANLGLGNMDEYKKAVAHANSVNHEDWMMKGFLKQAQELSKLMKKTSHLLKMQWAETAELVI
jgi:tetratricopeptide (TPR) repeat protein